MKTLPTNQVSITLLLLFLVSGCVNTPFIYPEIMGQPEQNKLFLRSDVYKTDNAEYQVELGTLVVPENRNDINSRLIKLPLIWIKSKSKSPNKPIFILNGGPGASNMKFTWPEYLLNNHDVIMLGYRGADGNSVLRCQEVSEALATDDDVLSEKHLKVVGKALNECSTRLKKQGVDLNKYTLLDVIDDIEFARKSLGFEQINLLGASYGTRVAYLYGIRHPKSIHRSVLVGATPPGHFGWEPKMVDSQIQYYSRLCSADPKCNSKVSDLAATMKSVVENMPESWLVFDINPDKVKLATFISLYHRKEAAKVFDAYIAAENGDPSGLALMSLAYDLTMPESVIWGDFFAKSYSADFDSERDYLTDMAPGDSVIGSPLGKLAWGAIQHSNWQMKMLPQKYRQLNKSNIETLILSGSVDFSTPAEWATKNLLPYLPNGQQVIISEVGHRRDVYNVSFEISKTLLMDFYSTGKVDRSKNVYIPMEFESSWKWPETAKLGVGSVTALLLLLLL